MAIPYEREKLNALFREGMCVLVVKNGVRVRIIIDSFMLFLTACNLDS